MRNKKQISLIVVMLLVAASFILVGFAAQEVKVTIDGNPVYFPDQKPVLYNDRTLVPIRMIAEELGAEVTWLNDTKDVVVKKGSDIIVLRIDSKTISKNGVLSNTDVAPMILGDRTMVPLRLVSENLGVGVKWDQNTYTVIIMTNVKPGNIITLPPDADAIDKKIQELALDNSSWGNIYTADKDSARDYITDLAEIGLNLSDSTHRTAGFFDSETGDGYVAVQTNTDNEFGNHHLVLYQEKSTKLSYDAMWCAITSLFSDQDAVKIWTSYTTLIKNLGNGNWDDVTGTAGGYNYNCHLESGGYAISFDKQ